MKMLLKKPSILPGFHIALGFTVFYLLLIVLIPLSGLVLHSAALPANRWVEIIASPRVQSAFFLTFWTSALAALVNMMFGAVVAWVLVRYRFPGKSLLDALVDMPFALPTAVAGIALTALYAPSGWVGKYLTPLGIHAAFTPLGIVIALIFVGLPFVVRTVEPVLRDINQEVEEAARSLGATRWQSFHRVTLPYLTPALITGFAMAFARGLGEYGSVIFIAGNIPGESEILPLLIVSHLEEYDYAGATAIALMMLSVSFLLLLAINLLQTRLRGGKT